MSSLRAPSQHEHTTDQTRMVQIHYEPLAQIGTGGMGVITLSKALTGPASGRFVAIKRLHSHLERDPEVVESFLDEVWLTAAMRHPNVVEPLDWGRDDEGSFLVTEFVPGDSLRSLLRSCEAAGEMLPIAVVAEIIARAAKGLHAAHELKNEAGESLHVVHRDVSPANILVSFDGDVKLIDFGVAKRSERIATTKAGTIKGKVGYMSPEQVRGRDLDRRSDLFSLGTVMWESLTLCRLFAPPTEFEAVRMICEEETLAPSEIRGDIPIALDALVLRCVEKSPDARLKNCADLEAALAPFRPPAHEANALLASFVTRLLPERRAWISSLLDLASEPTDVGSTPDATVRAEAVDPLGPSDTAPATPEGAESKVTAAAKPSVMRAPSTTGTSAADHDTMFMAGLPRDEPSSKEIGNAAPSPNDPSKRTANPGLTPSTSGVAGLLRSRGAAIAVFVGIAFIALLVGMWAGRG